MVRNAIEVCFHKVPDKAQVNLCNICVLVVQVSENRITYY